MGDQSNTISNPFLKGMHASFGNDNKELFSRKKLYDDLPRLHDKIYFDEKNVILILKDKTQLGELHFQLLDNKIREFCFQNSFLFDGKSQNLKRHVFEESGKKEEVIFEEMILCLKRKPNNFNVIFMGVSFDLSSESVRFLI